MESPFPNNRDAAPEFAELVQEVAGRFDDLRLSAGPAGGDYIPMAALAEAGAGLDTWLAVTATLAPGMDRRTTAAYFIGALAWSIGRALGALHLSGYPLPAITPSMLAVRQQVLPVAGRKAAAAIYYHLRVAASLSPPTAAALDRTNLRATIEALHAPLIEALHVRTRLSRRAQWLLVADGLTAGFLDIGKRTGAAEQAMAEAMGIIHHAGSPLSKSRATFVQVRISEPVAACEWFRVRGGCCRFYTTTGGEYCTTCVLRAPAEREARLQDFLRRRSI